MLLLSNQRLSKPNMDPYIQRTIYKYKDKNIYLIWQVKLMNI